MRKPFSFTPFACSSGNFGSSLCAAHAYAYKWERKKTRWNLTLKSLNIKISIHTIDKAFYSAKNPARAAPCVTTTTTSTVVAAAVITAYATIHAIVAGLQLHILILYAILFPFNFFSSFTVSLRVCVDVRLWTAYARFSVGKIAMAL